VQFNLTLSDISRHSTLTARVPKGSQVQFPIGHVNGGLGRDIMVDDRSPLETALFMLHSGCSPVSLACQILTLTIVLLCIMLHTRFMPPFS
jgi:hypothetical protein